MRQVRHSGLTRNDGLVVADGERVSMAREDVAEGSAAMTGLRRLLTEQQVAYSTNNRISTSGICKFARDGPGPSYAIRFAFGMLPLLIYETILCFPILWKAIQNYGNGWVFIFIRNVSSPFSVLTSPSTAPLGMFIISLPAHQREVKITTVTPALDEFYRFHPHYSVLILSDVTVADEVFNSSWALLASSQLFISKWWPYFPHMNA
ncbi:hypothetical protein BU17DRAFT_60062 [Hysterangium stoloniferum]|nr:hypothetical protein BU17DRAFT_60062 [Hysterangium stoloniferum]